MSLRRNAHAERQAMPLEKIVNSLYQRATWASFQRSHVMSVPRRPAPFPPAFSLSHGTKVFQTPHVAIVEALEMFQAANLVIRVQSFHASMNLAQFSNISQVLRPTRVSFHTQ